MCQSHWSTDFYSFTTGLICLAKKKVLYFLGHSQAKSRISHGMGNMIEIEGEHNIVTVVMLHGVGC